MSARIYNSVSGVKLLASMDAFVDPITDTLDNGVPSKPLPLADVLRNVDAFHAQCVGGGHVCGLPARLIKFDIFRDFLLPLRTYRAAQA